jgi:transposase
MTLLPKVLGLRLENATINADFVELTLTSTRLPVTCPACDQQTARLHSHYRRTVADLPWAGRRVGLPLNVRKFRCPEEGCQRQIFTERLPDLVRRHARKTTRLHEVLELKNFAEGIVSQNLAAVRAALTEVWSNGQVEGQINRL